MSFLKFCFTFKRLQKNLHKNGFIFFNFVFQFCFTEKDFKKHCIKKNFFFSALYQKVYRKT